MGFIGKDMKAAAVVRRTEVDSRTSHPPGKSEGGGGSTNQLWKERLNKGVPRELMHGLPLPKLQLLVKTWKPTSKNLPRKEGGPPIPMPQKATTPTALA